MLNPHVCVCKEQNSSRVWKNNKSPEKSNNLTSNISQLTRWSIDMGHTRRSTLKKIGKLRNARVNDKNTTPRIRIVTLDLLWAEKRWIPLPRGTQVLFSGKSVK